MRILQVILPGTSQYELKSQRIDRAALLAKGHAVSVDLHSQADLAHVYGPQLLDLDGFVAEAFVSGTPVVAARTAINEIRSDKGRTANLVRPADSNELTHAILTALFKPELAQQKVQAARLTASKFRSERRLRLLMQIYENLTL